MELNELEQFLLDNRSKLDEVESIDTEKIWNNISVEKESEQSPSPTSGWTLRMGRYWKWSIAASLAIALSFFFILSPEKKVDNSYQQNYYSLASLSEELGQQEASFKRRIAQKEEEIGLDELDKKAYQEIFMELKLLDEMYNTFASDIPEFNNDQLVETLIKYYERKIRILERLSKEIEKKKHHENRNTQRQI